MKSTANCLCKGKYTMELYHELLKLSGIELNESEQILLTEGVAELKRQYPNISDNDYQQLIRMDPTYGGGNEIGKFGRWILDLYNLFVKDRLAEEKYEKAKEYVAQHPEANLPPAPVQKSSDRIEDFQKLPDLLTKFLRVEKDIKKPINSFKSVADLASAVRASEEKDITVDKKAETNYQVFRDAISDGLKVVYQDNDWVIGIPETYESSAHFKKPVTDWCTAYPERYSYYMEENGGKYYIHLNKHTGDLYQMHFESGQFKDASDAEIDKYAFIKTYPNLKGFYTKLLFKPGYMEMENFKKFPSFTALIDISESPKEQYQIVSENPEFIGQTSPEVAKELLKNDLTLLRYLTGNNPLFMEFVQFAFDASEKSSSGVKKILIETLLNMFSEERLKITKEQKTKIFNDAVQKVFTKLDAYDKPDVLNMLAPKTINFINPDNYKILLNDLIHTQKYIDKGGFLIAPYLTVSKTNFDYMGKVGITPFIVLKNYNSVAYSGTYFYDYITKVATADDFTHIFNDTLIPKFAKDRIAANFYNGMDAKTNAVIDEYFINEFKSGDSGTLLIVSRENKKSVLSKYFKYTPVAKWLRNSYLSATDTVIIDALAESGIVPNLTDDELTEIAMHPDWKFLRGPFIKYMLSENKLDALNKVGENLVPSSIDTPLIKNIAQSKSFSPEAIDAATEIFKKIISKRFLEFLEELNWSVKYKRSYTDAVIKKLAEIIRSDKTVSQDIKKQLSDSFSRALTFTDNNIVADVLFAYPNFVEVLYEKMPNEIRNFATETGHLDDLKDIV